MSIPKFKFQNKKWKSNFWIVYKKIDFESVVRIYVYRYNTNTYTLTINIYKYNYTNPSIRLPDYINLTSSIRLQPDDYRIKTITNYNQYHIHTHIHIQLHIHNHIFYNEFMQFYHTFTIKFWHQPINKNLLQTMTTYTKRDTKRTQRYQRSINRP